MGFGTLGFSEILVILLIVLVVFGPRRLPEVARALGHATREFRRSLNQLQRELESADPRSRARSILDSIGESAGPPPAARPQTPPRADDGHPAPDTVAGGRPSGPPPEPRAPDAAPADPDAADAAPTDADGGPVPSDASDALPRDPDASEGRSS